MNENFPSTHSEQFNYSSFKPNDLQQIEDPEAYHKRILAEEEEREAKVFFLLCFIFTSNFIYLLIEK